MTETHYIVVGCVASGKRHFYNLFKQHAPVDVKVTKWSGIDYNDNMKSYFHKYDICFLYVRSPHEVCMRRLYKKRPNMEIHTIADHVTPKRIQLATHMEHLNKLYDRQYYEDTSMFPQNAQEHYKKEGYSHMVDHYICRVIVVDNSVDGDDKLVASIRNIFDD
jgi:hypothetical protein